MRRVVLAGVLASLTLVLTACPNPPPGYRPPSVESTQIAPSPARPGDTLTFVLDVRDDQALTAVVPRYLITPSGRSLSVFGACPTEMEPQGSFTQVLVTVTCEIPPYASNGTWQLELFLNDSNYPTQDYPGRVTRIPFEVVDGNDDRRPPQLVEYRIEPAVVDQETTFTVTVRLRDEALPLTVGDTGSGSFNFTKLFAQNSTFWCRNPTYTPVSATEVDVSAQCTPSNYYNPGRSEPGLHLSFMNARDALGHETDIEMYVDVQPGP